MSVTRCCQPGVHAESSAEMAALERSRSMAGWPNKPFTCPWAECKSRSTSDSEVQNHIHIRLRLALAASTAFAFSASCRAQHKAASAGVEISRGCLAVHLVSLSPRT